MRNSQAVPLIILIPSCKYADFSRERTEPLSSYAWAVYSILNVKAGRGVESTDEEVTVNSDKSAVTVGQKSSDGFFFSSRDYSHGQI